MMSLFPLGAGNIETSEMRSRSKVNIKHLRQHWFFKKDLRKLKSSLCFLPFLHSLKPNLPSYEQMEGLTVDKLFNGPSFMETQPDLEQVHVLEDGTAVIYGCTVEQSQLPDPEKMQLDEYLMEETKPLNTNFILPDQQLALCYTCPVYFGSFENKQRVLEALCNEIHSFQSGE